MKLKIFSTSFLVQNHFFSQNPLVNCVELSIESEMFTRRTLRAGSLCSQINNFIESLSETTSDYPWKEVKKERRQRRRLPVAGKTLEMRYEFVAYRLGRIKKQLSNMAADKNTLAHFLRFSVISILSLGKCELLHLLGLNML